MKNSSLLPDNDLDGPLLLRSYFSEAYKPYNYWNSLLDISMQEDCTVQTVLEKINNHRPQHVSLIDAIIVFIKAYYNFVG